MTPDRRWWVYDLPLQGDPLFQLSLVLGALSLVGTIVNRDQYGEGAFLLTVLLTFPLTVLWVGIIGGTIREFRRGRRQGQ